MRINARKYATSVRFDQDPERLLDGKRARGVPQVCLLSCRKQIDTATRAETSGTFVSYDGSISTW